MTWFWDNEVESNEMLKVEFCGVPRHEQSNHLNSSHFRNNDTPTLGLFFLDSFFTCLSLAISIFFVCSLDHLPIVFHQNEKRKKKQSSATITFKKRKKQIEEK